MPDEKTLKAFYDNESYFQGDAKGSYTDYDFNTEAVLSLFRDLLLTIPHAAGKKILDIGCAFGTHLAIAAQQGWETWGVELSDHAREIALSRHGEKVHVVEAIDSLPRLEFDLIVMLDVLEHVPNPYELFIELFLHGVIGSKTQLVITTPNARSVDALADPAGWAYRHPPSHLVHFSSRSLRLLLANLGCNELSIQGIYPIESRESCDYPDENNSSNQYFKHYAGLMSVVQGFDSSLLRLLDNFKGELSSLKNSKKAQLCQRVFRIHNKLMLEYASKEQSLKETLADLKEMVEAKEVELGKMEEEILRVYQSKWHRLGCAIKSRPVTLHNLAAITYLMVGLITPTRLRNKMSPLASKWRQRRLQQQRQNISSQHLKGNSSYLVRRPLPSMENRPRIIHVIANFCTGGSSRLVTDLIEYLGQYYEQSVFTQYMPTPPDYVGLDITEYPFPVDEQPFIEHFARVKPALIHVHYWGDCDKPWYAKAFMAAEQLNIPVVENINTPITPYFSSAVTRYIYVSDYVRRVFGKDGPSHVTIYPGCDFAHFYREENEPQTENCVGMVYRLERDKLNEASILPFVCAVKNRPNTQVLIVGGGSLLEEYKRVVAREGITMNFEFTDYVSYTRLPELYRRMAVFVAPVCKESFGQVSPFAMNMKIPVCGYRVGAISEIVGSTALLASAADPQHLAKIIVRLLDSGEERKAVGEQQHRRAQEYFSVEKMIRSYRDIYRQLTGIPTQ